MFKACKRDATNQFCYIQVEVLWVVTNVSEAANSSKVFSVVTPCNVTVGQQGPSRSSGLWRRVLS